MIRAYGETYVGQEFQQEKRRKVETKEEGICSLWQKLSEDMQRLSPQNNDHRINQYVDRIKKIIADVPEGAAILASTGLDDVAAYLGLGFKSKYADFYAATIKIVSSRLIDQLFALARVDLPPTICHRARLYAAALSLQQNSFQKPSNENDQACHILKHYDSCETSHEDMLLVLDFAMQHLTQTASLLKITDQIDDLTN